jgi:hypothetical protein
MSDLFDWIQSYWFEWGSLAIQLAILAVVVSYGRKAVRLLSAPLAASRAASQAQVELLHDLETLSGTPISRSAAEPRASVYGGVGRMISPMPEGTAWREAEPAVTVRVRHEGGSPWQALVGWLQTPMGNHHARPWRRVIRQVS